MKYSRRGDRWQAVHLALFLIFYLKRFYFFKYSPYLYQCIYSSLVYTCLYVTLCTLYFFQSYIFIFISGGNTSILLKHEQHQQYKTRLSAHRIPTNPYPTRLPVFNFCVFLYISIYIHIHTSTHIHIPTQIYTFPPQGSFQSLNHYLH